MAGGRVELIMALTGENQLTAALSTANRDLDQFAGKARESGKSTATAMASIDGEIKQTGLSVSDVATGFLGLKSAAQSALAIVQQLGEHIAAGEVANNVDVVFRAVNKGADDTLARLQEAGRFEFDDTTLQAMTNRWHLLGVEAKDAASIIELGTKVAQATMSDATQTTDAFFNAVAKGRDGALKSMGIVVDLKGAVDDYAESIGKATADLSDHELQQVRVAAINREVSKTLEDIPLDQVTNRVGQAKRAWDNFKSNLEVKAFTALADVLDTVNEATETTAGNFQDLSPETAALTAEIQQLGREADWSTGKLGGLAQIAAGMTALLNGKLSEARVEEAKADNAAEVRAAQREAAERARTALRRKWAEEQLQALEIIEATSVRLTATQRADLDSAKAYAEVTRDLASSKITAAQADAQRNLILLRHEAALAGATEATKAADNSLRDYAAAARDMSREASVAFKDLAAQLADLGADMERELAGLAVRQQAARDASHALAMARQSEHLDELGRARLEHEDRLSQILQQEATDEIDRQRIRDEADLERLQWTSEERILIKARETEAAEEHSRRLQDAADTLTRLGRAADEADFGGLGVGTKLFAAFAASTDALVKGTPGAIAALGARAGAAMNNKKAEAILLAAFEGAEALRSFANFDFWGGGMHLAAAAAYGAMAGGASSSPSGGGGGGGAGGGGTKNALTAPVSQSSGPTIGGGSSLTLNLVGGYYFGDRDDAAVNVGKTLARATGTGFHGGAVGV